MIEKFWGATGRFTGKFHGQDGVHLDTWPGDAQPLLLYKEYPINIYTSVKIPTSVDSIRM